MSTADLLEEGNHVRKRHWLMALGEGSRLWDTCYEQGIAVMGGTCDPPGDLRRFASKCELPALLGKNDRLACWEFCNVMAPGDTILVKKGVKHLLGRGVITGDYLFERARLEYKHVREVRWLPKCDHPGLSIESQLKKRGLTQLPQKGLTNITKNQALIDAAAEAGI